MMQLLFTMPLSMVMLVPMLSLRTHREGFQSDQQRRGKLRFLLVFTRNIPKLESHTHQAQLIHC